MEKVLIKTLIFVAILILVTGCSVQQIFNSEVYNHNQKMIAESKDKDKVCRKTWPYDQPPSEISMGIKEAAALAERAGCFKNSKLVSNQYTEPVFCDSMGYWHFRFNAIEMDDLFSCLVNVETKEVSKTYIYDMGSGYKASGN